MLRADVIAPSRLAPAELAVWSRMLHVTPHLRRAFFTPGFARACEAAHSRAYVMVLHDGGTVRAFLPFQFSSSWHARLRLAERIGGELCDNAGLIAEPGFAIDSTALLRCCGLGVLFITHLSEGQEAFGLIPGEWEIGHHIDLSAGSASYFAALRVNRKGFVQDTERRLRRAAREYGPLTFASVTRPEREEVMRLIADKRRQYQRTDTGDAFADPRRLRVIEALTEAPTPDCMPVLSTLTAGERVLARHLGLLHAGVLNYWFPVYDVAAQKISPGRLLLWHMIEQAENLGIRLIDRGAGDSEAKRDFSTGTTRFGLANFSAGTLRSGLARLGQAAEWRLDRLRGAGWWRRRSAS
jgi:CelD/BcsL family acetyltransferase involved in cellulose biosynthesis